ncbi:MAG: OmpA family protein [Rhodospirillales bacterium]
MRKIFAPFIALPLVVAGLPVFAQSSPSADQIIKSLMPSGNLVAGGTRGIRLGAPAPSVPSSAIPIATGQPRPPAHATPAHAPQTAAPSANLTVNFASGSADLTPQAIQALNELGRALSSQDLAGYKFRIEGHTDTVGTADANRQLSEQRANAVVAYITSHFGVDPGRLQAIGKGQEELAVPTPSQTAEPRNRRVLVVNLGA